MFNLLALWPVYETCGAGGPAAHRSSVLLLTQGKGLHGTMCTKLYISLSSIVAAVDILCFSLQKAVLACINVTSLRQMFLQFQALPDLWRVSRIDFVSIAPSVCNLMFNILDISIS